MVTIVMCVFGRSELTRKSLQSLIDSIAGYDRRLVIVDNDSGPKTQQVLRDFQKCINLLILSSQNHGKPYAWNLGFQAAETNCHFHGISPSEIYVFADNDVEYKPYWLDRMEKAYGELKRRKEKIGILSGFASRGAKILKEELLHFTKDGQSLIDDASNLLAPTTVRVETIRIQMVKYPAGCNFMIGRDVLLNEGLFNTDRLIRAVDTEYAKFLTLKGYRHFIVPGMVNHLGEHQRTWKIGAQNEVTLFD